MKALVGELIYFVILNILVNVIYFEIYPQYHEWCFSFIVFLTVAGLVDVVKKIIRYRRERKHCKDI